MLKQAEYERTKGGCINAAAFFLCYVFCGFSQIIVKTVEVTSINGAVIIFIVSGISGTINRRNSGINANECAAIVTVSEPVFSYAIAIITHRITLFTIESTFAVGSDKRNVIIALIIIALVGEKDFLSVLRITPLFIISLETGEIISTNNIVTSETELLVELWLINNKKLNM